MSQISGVVEQVNRTDGPGGKWKKVSVKVKGAWYSGFINAKDTDDRAAVKEGDTAEVTYVENGRFLNIENLKIVTQANNSEENVSKKSKAVAGTTQVQEYVPSNIRDLRITIAGARNTAIEFVRLALDSKAIELKSTKGKKVDELLAHVNYYTEVFAKQLLNTTEADLQNNDETEAAKGEDEEYSE